MVFITYGVIPLIVIAGVIIYIANKDPDEELTMNKKQIFNYDYGSDFYLFENASNFEDIKFFLSNTSLVVNDNDLGNKLVQYIKDEMNLSLILYSKENQLNNHSQNIVILDYDSDKDTYKFTYKEKEIIEYNTTQNFPFSYLYLSTDKAMDVFNYQYDYKKYFWTHEYNKIFLIYQAFFSKFLIEKVKGKNLNGKDIHFNFGFNSYPEAVQNPRSYDSTEVMLSYLITMQFTFVFLSFSIQMLEEKELKLEKLLERQGINLAKYICSWFLNYIIVSLLSNIATIMGGIEILQDLYGIFILDIILFNLGLFSLLFFITTVSKSKKVGLILVNLIGFGSLVFGYVLNQGSPHEVIQILFNFFPNANLFCSIKLIVKLQFLGRATLDNLRLNYNGNYFLFWYFSFY